MLIEILAGGSIAVLSGSLGFIISKKK